MKLKQEWRFRLLSVIAVVALTGVALVCGCGEDEEAEAGPPIVVKGSMSATGKYASQGQQTAWGIQTIAKWVNETHGGVKVGGSKRLIEYSYEDDASESDKVESTYNTICADETVDFVMGPYASGLTLAAAPIVDACGKLLMDHGGASNSIFASGYKNIVQVLSPASDYHRGAFDLLEAAAGSGVSLKVALLYQDNSFAKSVRDAAKTYAEQRGHTVVLDELYPSGVDETSAELIALVDQVATADPDVVLGGRGNGDGQAVVKLLAQKNIEPKLVSLLVGPALPDFYQNVQECDGCDYASHPAEGVCAPAQWEVGVKYSPESAASDGMEWFGPTQAEFVSLFESVAGADKSPSYQAAQAGQAVLALVLAIEKADSVETAAVRTALGNLKFRSFFGDYEIDATGLQTGHKMVELQWQQGQKVIVWPSAAKTADAVYPMP